MLMCHALLRSQSTGCDGKVMPDVVWLFAEPLDSGDKDKVFRRINQEVTKPSL